MLVLTVGFLVPKIVCVLAIMLASEWLIVLPHTLHGIAEVRIWWTRRLGETTCSILFTSGLDTDPVRRLRDDSLLWICIATTRYNLAGHTILMNGLSVRVITTK